MTPSEVYVGQMLRGARRFQLTRAFREELEAHLERAREALGDHVRAVRALARAGGPVSLEGLATSIGLGVDRTEEVLSDLGGWGWVQAHNEPPVFRLVEGKEARSPWVLR